MPCKFFPLGTCLNGNNCRFIHEIPEDSLNNASTAPESFFGPVYTSKTKKNDELSHEKYAHVSDLCSNNLIALEPLKEITDYGDNLDQRTAGNI